jgi:hypothetical protein
MAPSIRGYRHGLSATEGGEANPSIEALAALWTAR